MKWTPWRVWTHPLKALEVIDKSEKTKEDLEKRLNETMELMENQRRECARLTSVMADMGERLLSREKELLTTRAELEKAREELEEQKSIDIKLGEFERMLTKVEVMKRDYEKRISTLEARLRDARAKLGSSDNYDLFEPINMETSLPVGSELNLRNPAAVITRRQREVIEEAVNPEREIAQALPPAEVRRRQKDAEEEKRAPGLPEVLPTPSASDDWLIGLPDSL